MNEQIVKRRCWTTADIVDWRLRQVEVYRREHGLLPGFTCLVERFFV